MNNDRFKFRVWDKGNKRYQGTQDWQPYLDTDGDVCFINTDDVRDYPPENYFIVEQCTGLKDKNGNLIYENDKITIRHETGKICFGFYRKTDEHFSDGIYGWYIEWDNPNCWLRQDLGYFIGEGIEIIGNIHEQKEEK